MEDFMSDLMDSLECFLNNTNKFLVVATAVVVFFVIGLAIGHDLTDRALSNNTATHIDNNVPGITTIKNSTSTIDAYGDGTVIVHQGNSIFVMHSK